MPNQLGQIALRRRRDSRQDGRKRGGGREKRSVEKTTFIEICFEKGRKRCMLKMFDTGIYVNNAREGCSLSQQSFSSLLHDATMMNLTMYECRAFPPFSPPLFFLTSPSLFLSWCWCVFSWRTWFMLFSGNLEKWPLIPIQLSLEWSFYRLKKYKNHCGEMREEQQSVKFLHHFFNLHHFSSSQYIISAL